MAEIIVNAHGLSCPQPVILVQQAIKRGQFPILVQLDSETSRENVQRMAESKGLAVTVRTKTGEIELIIDQIK